MTLIELYSSKNNKKKKNDNKENKFFFTFLSNNRCVKISLTYSNYIVHIINIEYSNECLRLFKYYVNYHRIDSTAPSF